MPPYADGGRNQWIEVTVVDSSALPAGWRLHHAREGVVNVIIDSTTFSWALQNGDIIRTHPSTWPFEKDKDKSNNNPDRWDYKTSSIYGFDSRGSIYGFDSRAGFVFISDSSNIIHDAVIYANGNEDISVTGDAREVLTAAVLGGLWPGDDKSSAFDIGDTTSKFARLTDTSRHGSDASAWETITYHEVPDFLIINEINSEGGFGTNSLTSDFVELYNNSGATIVIEADRWFLGKGNANYHPSSFTALPAGRVAAGHFYLVTFGGSAPATVGDLTRALAIPTELGNNETVSLFYKQDDGWFSEWASHTYTGAAHSWGRFPDGEAIDRDGDQMPTPGASNKDAPTSGIFYGSSETLDIVAWNIERFPKQDATIESLYPIIDSLNVDIIALQEITDTTAFNNLISRLGGDWIGYRSDNGGFAELSYLINTAEIAIISNPYKILNDSEYYFAYREPYLLEFNYNNTNYILINIHYKCCSGSEDRRKQSSILLKNYIDNNFSENNVIVVGDFNDNLIDDENVFAPFLIDTSNYYFTDYPIADEGNSYFWSYPSWPSHLDHILITDELFESVHNTEVLLIDQWYFDSFDDYDTFISDHRPIAVQLD